MSQIAPLHEQMPERRDPRRSGMAVLMLALCCVFWGFSFPSMQMISRAWDEALPAGLSSTKTARVLGLRATFLGWRFALAGGLYWVLTRSRQRGFRAIDLQAGLTVGSIMAGGMLLQLLGLRYTLPSISAFLTALSVVFAPLAQGFIFRQRVAPSIWLAVLIAIAGTVVLSRPDPTAIHTEPLASTAPIKYLGEILTIISAVLFTAQILAVDRFGPRADVARMTLLVLVTTAALNTVAGAVLAGGAIYRPRVLLALLTANSFWWAMPTLIVFSTVLALHLMNIYQPRISPAAACVAYCLEPLFATMFSIGFATESLARNTILGGATVLAAVLLIAWAERRPRGAAMPNAGC